MTINAATEDRMLGGRVKVAQPAAGYRIAVDPVFLAAALVGNVRGRLLDVGCGVGAVMLCALARMPALEAVGIEVQPEYAALARANLARNGWQERGCIVEGDFARCSVPFPANSFDLAAVNPPYRRSGTASAHAGRETAHGDTLGPAVWIGFCLKMLKPGGRLALIHRAEALGGILAALDGKAGSVEVIPLWPKAGAPAKRLVVRAAKGGKGPLVLHPGLVLHERNGTYSAGAERVLRDGADLDAAIKEAAADDCPPAP